MSGTDLHDELERSIGHGPTLASPADRLAAGRVALRRRRAVVAVGAAAAVMAVVVPVAALSGTAAPGGEAPPVAPPTSRETPTASPDDRATDEAPPEPTASDLAAEWPWGKGQVATVDPIEHLLLIRPGAEVLERRDDLYPGKETSSVAMILEFRGGRYWVALEWDRGGSSGTYGRPGNPFYEDFDDFVAKATSGGGMTSGAVARPGGGGEEFPEQGEVVGLAWEGDRLVASGDTEIFEQRSDVDLGPTFAAESDTTGAALVQMAGERQLVLYRETEGAEGQLIAVLSAGHGDTLDALLTWARERYESGEGLL